MTIAVFRQASSTLASAEYLAIPAFMNIMWNFPLLRFDLSKKVIEVADKAVNARP